MDARLRSASKKDEPALVTALFSRRLAQPLARLCVRLGIPANAVTVAGGRKFVVPALDEAVGPPALGCGSPAPCFGTPATGSTSSTAPSPA